MPKPKKPAPRPESPPRKPYRGWLLAACAGLLLVATLGLWWWVQNSNPALPVSASAPAKAPASTPAPLAVTPAPTTTMVDELQCQGCHQAQFKSWQGSHHQQAMKPAAEGNVLGDFANVTFKGETETTRFFRKEGEY